MKAVIVFKQRGAKGLFKRKRFVLSAYGKGKSLYAEVLSLLKSYKTQ